jgi:hypothetical protein
MQDFNVQQIEVVPLEKLFTWDKNPRKITKERMDNLKKSMTEDPEQLGSRMVLVQKGGRIYGGNQRYAAAKEMGWTHIPCIFSDISDKKAEKRAVQDNSNFGEWDNSISDLLDELAAEGVDIDTLGLSRELEKMAKNLEQVNSDAEWEDMPEYLNEDKSAFKQLIVSFMNDEDYQKFQLLLGAKMTMKTKSIWYPLQKQDSIDEEFA